jgi:hypothetical protein
MPLPAGFKVNGFATVTRQFHISPRIKKIMDILDKMPKNEVVTTMELSMRLGMSVSGNFTNQPVLEPYREKIDNKLFWGNRKSIANLRKQLSTSEGPNVKD